MACKKTRLSSQGMFYNYATRLEQLNASAVSVQIEGRTFNQVYSVIGLKWALGLRACRQQLDKDLLYGSKGFSSSRRI